VLQELAGETAAPAWAIASMLFFLGLWLAIALATWRARLAGRMRVLSRAEAVAAGWFGRVAPFVLPRIGDVVAVAEDRFAVVDSRTARPGLLRLIGLHGARTPEETEVPLLATLGHGR
jgi:hypothetical protein